jgi:ABC-type transporter Mla subunit MlaD
MTPQNWIRIGLLVLLLIGSFRLGSNLKQAEWDRTENERLREVSAALEAHKRTVDDLNEELAERELALATTEAETRELNDALQAEINREPVTTVVTVERDNCPKVEFYVPDTREYWRLWNCGITGDCDPSATGSAGTVDGAVPGTEPTAGISKDYATGAPGPDGDMDQG